MRRVQRRAALPPRQCEVRREILRMSLKALLGAGAQGCAEVPRFYTTIATAQSPGPTIYIGEKLHAAAVLRRVARPPAVMVWVAMSRFGKAVASHRTPIVGCNAIRPRATDRYRRGSPLPATPKHCHNSSCAQDRSPAQTPIGVRWLATAFPKFSTSTNASRPQTSHRVQPEHLHYAPKISAKRKSPGALSRSRAFFLRCCL